MAKTQRQDEVNSELKYPTYHQTKVGPKETNISYASIAS
jgi:hypothetical protein